MPQQEENEGLGRRSKGIPAVVPPVDGSPTNPPSNAKLPTIFLLGLLVLSCLFVGAAAEPSDGDIMLLEKDYVWERRFYLYTDERVHIGRADNISSSQVYFVEVWGNETLGFILQTSNGTHDHRFWFGANTEMRRLYYEPIGNYINVTVQAKDGADAEGTISIYTIHIIAFEEASDEQPTEEQAIINLVTDARDDWSGFWAAVILVELLVGFRIGEHRRDRRRGRLRLDTLWPTYDDYGG